MAAADATPFRTANPALRDDTFRDLAATGGESAMTLQGAVLKTGALLLLCAAAASFTWSRFATGGPAAATPWMFGGFAGGLVVGLVAAFWKRAAPFLAPAYAALQGFALGGLSAFFETRFPGIVVQAVGLTFGTLGALLLAYTSGLIKPTENFKLGIVAATGAIMLLYLASFVLSFFSIPMPYLHDSGPVGIGISLVIVVVAALNLVLDFDFIERGAKDRAPKYMEWYAAFGLLVTLVWLYLEMLRLLAKIRSKD